MIIWHRPMFRQRFGQDTLEEKRYVATFLVGTNNRFDGPTVIKAHPDTPRVGQPYPDDPDASVVQVDCVQNDNTSYWWTVIVNYSDQPDREDNPLDDPVIVQWSSETFQEPVVYDKDGDMVLNSAGDPYDPPVMRDRSRWVATLSVNVSEVPGWVTEYQDAINETSCSIGGYPILAQEGKCGNMTISELKRRNDVEYYTLSYSVSINKDLWLAEPLDLGMREIPTFPDYSDTVNYKVGTPVHWPASAGGDDKNHRAIQVNGPATTVANPSNSAYWESEDDDDTLNGLVEIRNADGEEVSRPVPLDGAGKGLPDPTATTAVFNTHPIYDELEFKDLPGIGEGRPLAKLTSSSIPQLVISVKINWSEEVTGFAQGDLELDNCTITSWTENVAGEEYTVELTKVSDEPGGYGFRIPEGVCTSVATGNDNFPSTYRHRY